MPTYEYQCEADGSHVEVFHSMSQSPKTWGELCEIRGVDPGNIPPGSPVKRVLSASAVHTPQMGEWKRTGKKSVPAGHSHGPGCGCGH